MDYLNPMLLLLWVFLPLFIPDMRTVPDKRPLMC